MVWYGKLEFNIPPDTAQVILEMGALSSDVHLPFSNPHCFCLHGPKGMELAPNPHYSGGS